MIQKIDVIGLLQNISGSKKVLKLFLGTLLPVFFLLKFTSEVAAQTTDQYVSIVNPVRISVYNTDPQRSIKTQYEVIRELELPATWLFTYDALHHDGVLQEVLLMDKNQEFGIYLEVTEALATASGVKYNDTGSWHHASSVFLSGYSQDDRKKLIDTVFQAFHKKLGYYPTAVGSWWTDSFSLSYMKEKYKVIANLGCADQYATDGYQLWGQYWSKPFYPTKTHAGVPASDQGTGIVTMQWASRDPLNGYENSLYSTQDYAVPWVNLPTEYFIKLVELYGFKHENEFGHIVVGLESDLEYKAYTGEFVKQMSVIKSFTEGGHLKAKNMSDFAQWFQSRYQKSPSYIVRSKDLLNSQTESFWYQSPSLRVGLFHNHQHKTTEIVDLRTYHNDFVEPYFIMPNKEFKLEIYVPSLLDRVNYPQDSWILQTGGFLEAFKYGETYTLKFERGDIIFDTESFKVNISDVSVPVQITQSRQLSQLKRDGYTEFNVSKDWLVGKEGYQFSDFTPQASHLLRSTKFQATTLLVLLTSIIVIFIFFRVLRGTKRIVIPFLMVISICGIILFAYKNNTQNYFVSQDEVAALTYLSHLHSGKVLVIDQECLQCNWSSTIQPAVFANKRGYVSLFSEKQIVYDKNLLLHKNVESAKTYFSNLNVDYVYLVTYEDYVEVLPLSPGDYNLEKVYDNANAQVWRIKE